MQMTAELPTARAAALMGTMTKHFGHKIPVELLEDRATIWFEAGQARMAVTDRGLQLTVEAEAAEALGRLQGVVESHLLRFAHREEPEALVWLPAA
jgi:uncharacterized protein